MRDPFEPQIRCLLCFGAASNVMAIDLYKDRLGYSRDRNPCIKRKHHNLLSVIHLPSGGYTLCVFGLVNTYGGEGLEFVFPEFVRLLEVRTNVATQSHRIVSKRLSYLSRGCKTSRGRYDSRVSGLPQVARIRKVCLPQGDVQKHFFSQVQYLY